MQQSAIAGCPTQKTGFETIHGPVLRHFSALVGELGGDSAALLAQVGILPASAAQHRIRVSYRQFVSLLELGSAHFACPDFGMQLALRQGAAALAGPLGNGMRNSRNFDAALHFLCGHSYAHSLAAWIWRKPSMSGMNTMVGHDILLENLPQKSQAMEYALLVGNLATLELTEGRVRARRVFFRHQPISSLKLYRRNFGCEVSFGRDADAVLYTAQDLSCPITDPNARAFQTAADTIKARFARQKPPLQADIRGIIAHVLGTEYCTREHVATKLGLHHRTMARRLADEGTSFQQIKDQVRRDRMLYYLQRTGLEFTAISERLGFSEQAVMTRCCHKWFAMSPSAMRSALRKSNEGTSGAAHFVSIDQSRAA